MGEMLFEVFYICSSAHHFEHRSGMFCAIVVGNFPRNNLIKFGWNPPSGYGGDVIWNFSNFCSGLHFVQWSWIIWAILVAGLPRNNPSFVAIRQVVMEEMLFEFFSTFSSGGHFVHWRRTVWAILVEDLPKNYPIKFGWNLHRGYNGDVVWSFFYF